jgi:hypothetical protein
MLGKTTNPLLQKAEQAAQSKIPAQFQNAFQRIVTAGLKVMYSPQTHEMMVQEMNKPQPIEASAAEGVAKLMGILWHEGKGTLPMQAMIPAAVVLLCEGLDFAEKAGKAKVTPQILAEATKQCMSDLMQILGITPQKIQAAAAQAKQSQPAAPARGLIGNAMGA